MLPWKMANPSTHCDLSIAQVPISKPRGSASSMNTPLTEGKGIWVILVKALYPPFIPSNLE